MRYKYLCPEPQRTKARAHFAFDHPPSTTLRKALSYQKSSSFAREPANAPIQ